MGEFRSDFVARYLMTPSFRVSRVSPTASDPVSELSLSTNATLVAKALTSVSLILVSTLAASGSGAGLPGARPFLRTMSTKMEMATEPIVLVLGLQKYGVAKAANPIMVKVLGSNGSGTMADVVGGVPWAAEQAASKLAAAKSQALDNAVNKAVDSGMPFAVATRNDNRNACYYSPAAAEGAITVGASTLGDKRAYFQLRRVRRRVCAW
jgi:Subtilase family